MRRFLLAAFATAVALPLALAAAPRAGADGFIVPLRPERRVRGDWAVTYHRVDVRVEGQKARVRVDQEFENLSPVPLEAEYVFPLPHGAMVSAVTLVADGKPIEGRLLKAEEARRIYDEIVRRQKDPALVEYVGRDFFRASLFPIPPRGRRQLVLEYDHLLRRDGDTVEVLYPLSTEKFSARPLRDVRVTVDVAAAGTADLGPIYSPSHDVVVTRDGTKRARVSFEAREVRPDTDFLLYVSETEAEVGATLLTHWPRGEDRGYFLLLASPVVPDGKAAAAKPRHLTFVVDVSSSMIPKGKLEQAKSALVQTIGGLNDGDWFNVIAFSTAVNPLWDAAKPYTKENRAEAFQWIESLRGVGGTNIEAALKTALTEPAKEGLPHVVLFLTDGRPTMGAVASDEILATVRKASGDSRTRIFVFGVGVDVDGVFLDKLALDNRGVPTYVRPNEDIERKLAGLYEKIRFPVLSDLKIDLGALAASEVLPAAVPDLFRGGQVVVAGRYRKGGPADVVIAGQDGTLRREFRHKVVAGGPGEGLRDDFPARVWAMRRIGDLVDQIRLLGRREKELVDEIVSLSLRFGIVTEYTSFLADERTDPGALADLRGRALEALRRVGAPTADASAPGGAAPADGVAASENQKARREADKPPPAPSSPATAGRDGGARQGYAKAAEGGRDLVEETVEGVKQVANRAFYRRANVQKKAFAWVDAEVKDTSQVDETVERWSARFFELLSATTPDENARLSQEGDLLLRLQGRNVFVTDAAATDR
jgi:Ca-activated chloride channel family protein